MLVFVLAFGLANCSYPQEKNDIIAQDQKGNIAMNVNVEEFSKLLAEKKGLLLDVRTPKEVAEGKIANATNIDYYEKDFKDNISKFDKNIPIFVYCKSGGRSGSTLNFMKQLGFKEVYNLEGGFMAWMSVGKEISK